MGNRQVIEHLHWVSLLLELAEESPFKVRAYRDAADTIKRYNVPLSVDTEEKTLLVIKGIGQSVARTIIEFLRTGDSEILTIYRNKFTPGILEILASVRGLGVKKLQLIRSQFAIESLEDLLNLCENGQLAQLKGFGANSVEKLRKSLIFAKDNRGYLLYPQALEIAEYWKLRLRQFYPEIAISYLGELRRKQERLRNISMLVDLSMDKLAELLKSQNTSQKINFIAQDNHYSLEYVNGVRLQIYVSKKQDWGKNQLLLTGSREFLAKLNQEKALDDILNNSSNLYSEEDIFTRLDLTYITPEFREFHSLEYLKNRSLSLLEAKELRGIIHTHTNFSDGANTLEEMALSARAAGFEYIVISDHSQSSSVANGMKFASIQRQHTEIDELNQRLAPFKIFKSVECDILLDGSLDYPDEILALFDFVIVAIHQQLDMSKTKATNRVLRAISHPYASILAHPTGRLLNQRAGYELEFTEIFQASAEHKVAIEINTSSLRLDLDWRLIPQALEQGCLCSINPDAHTVEGILAVYRGVEIARKAGLQAKENLSSHTLNSLEEWIKIQQKKRK